MLRTRSLFDLFLAALSGAILACAFPQPDFSFFAWFALIPLILVMARRPFWSGYVAGIVFFASTLYWLNIVMVTYGRLHPLLSLVAYLLLVGYLSFYFAVATWLVSRLHDRFKYPISLTFPVIWVALELLRSVLLTGFPWVLLGYSQHNNLVAIQSVDLFGVYGLSGLIILTNCVIASVIEWVQNRQTRYRQGRYVFMLVLLLAANFIYGTIKLQGDYDVGTALDVSLIQGNIDQTLKWEPESQLQTVHRYRQLSEKAAAVDAGLIIWPESATPFYLQDPSVLQQTVLGIAKSSGHHLLTGSPAYARLADGSFNYYNSAFLISPLAGIVGRSDKVHLVPFGEYVPLGQFLPFIEKMVYGIGDFSAGEITPLAFTGEKFGVLVCYEAIFPELARAYANAGSGLLVNITNDAWFGKSSAPYQHLAMTRFRAIENRRWLVRSANTGISAIIDPVGHIVSQSSIFEKAALKGQVKFLSGSTLYSRFGDVLPLLFLLVSMVWLWQSRLRK